MSRKIAPVPCLSISPSSCPGSSSCQGKAEALLDAHQSISASQSTTATRSCLDRSSHSLEGKSLDSFHSAHPMLASERQSASLAESLSCAEAEQQNLPFSASSMDPLRKSISIAAPDSSLSSLSSLSLRTLAARSDLISWIACKLDADSSLDLHLDLSLFIERLQSHPLFKPLLAAELRQRTRHPSSRKRADMATAYLHAQLSPQFYRSITEAYKVSFPELMILLDLEEPGVEDASTSESRCLSSSRTEVLCSCGSFSRSIEVLPPSSYPESENDSFIEEYQERPPSQARDQDQANITIKISTEALRSASFTAEPCSLTLDALLQGILFEPCSSSASGCPMSALDFISTFDYYMNSFDLLRTMCLAWMAHTIANVEEQSYRSKRDLLALLKLWMQERPIHFYDSLEVLQLLFYFLQAIHAERERRHEQETDQAYERKRMERDASVCELVWQVAHALASVEDWKQWPQSIEYWQQRASATALPGSHKAHSVGDKGATASEAYDYLALLQFPCHRTATARDTTDEPSATQKGSLAFRATEQQEKRDALRVLSSLSLDEFVDYFATQAQGQVQKSMPVSWLVRCVAPRAAAQYLGHLEWCRYERLRGWTFYRQAWLLLPSSLSLLFASSSSSFGQAPTDNMSAKADDWQTNGALEVQYIIDWFNRMTRSIGRHVLASATPAERRSALAFWIRVGESAIALGHYQLAFQVAAALSSGPLARSTKLWKSMDRKTSEAHVALMALTNPRDRYANYRQHLKQRIQTVQLYQQRNGARSASMDPAQDETWPTLPFLGVLLSDLTFAEEANPTTLPEPQLDLASEPGNTEPLHMSPAVRFYPLCSHGALLNLAKLKMVSKLVHSFFEPLALNSHFLTNGLSEEMDPLLRPRVGLDLDLIRAWHELDHYFSRHFSYATEQVMYELSYAWEPIVHKKEAI